MTPIIHTMPQRSDEWFAVRLGKITGTSFGTMANGKKPTIETLCLKTAAERLTGVSSDNGFSNAAMENGTETEELARQAYETTDFSVVQAVGFLELDEYIGVSPDGLVGDDGGLELKCPMPHTHLQYLTQKSPHKAYRWQVQGALWVTGRKWWDFVSFCELFPPDKQLVIERVEPDMDCFARLEAGAEHCRNRIREIMEGLKDGEQNVRSGLGN